MKSRITRLSQKIPHSYYLKVAYDLECYFIFQEYFPFLQTVGLQCNLICSKLFLFGKENQFDIILLLVIWEKEIQQPSLSSAF